MFPAAVFPRAVFPDSVFPEFETVSSGPLPDLPGDVPEPVYPLRTSHYTTDRGAMLSQLNRAIRAFRYLCAKLDEDEGVADADFWSTLAAEGVSDVPREIG